MAPYLALKIVEGKFDYATIFSFKMYQPYQNDVDSILTAEGRKDLIVKKP